MGWWGFGLADWCRKRAVCTYRSSGGMLRNGKLPPHVWGPFRLGNGKIFSLWNLNCFNFSLFLGNASMPNGTVHAFVVTHTYHTQSIHPINFHQVTHPWHLYDPSPGKCAIAVRTSRVSPSDFDFGKRMWRNPVVIATIQSSATKSRTRGWFVGGLQKEQ